MLVLIGPVLEQASPAAILALPESWNGLTTNTIMLIDLDSPVAMIGNQPDMTYCVKKLQLV